MGIMMGASHFEHGVDSSGSGSGGINTFVPHLLQSTIVSDFLGSEGFVVTLLQSDTNLATFIPLRQAVSGFPILLGDCQIFVRQQR